MRNCPICDAKSLNAEEFLPLNIDSSKLNDFAYASRKNPEYMSNHMVRCGFCDLVYADSPPSQDSLHQAYHEADYDSTEEATDAAKAYIEALEPALGKLVKRTAALEIGTGTGVFLEQLEDAGFQTLVGIEPSVKAIEEASERARPWINLGMFDEKKFEPNSFDLICCFMTLEHVRDPKEISDAAFRLLAPGGVFVSVTHNYRGIVNKLMGRKSPIVDIEHLQLFSNKSIVELYNRSGFTNIQARAFSNKYSISYWLRLSPIPKLMKNYCLELFRFTKLGQIKLSVNVGNTMAFGFKPI